MNNDEKKKIDTPKNKTLAEKCLRIKKKKLKYGLKVFDNIRKLKHP